MNWYHCVILYHLYHLTTTLGSFRYCKSPMRLGDAAAGDFYERWTKKQLFFALKKTQDNSCFFQSTNVILKYINKSKSLNIHQLFRFFNSHSEILGSYLQQPHQPHVSRADFEAEPQARQRQTDSKEYSAPFLGPSWLIL